MHLYQEKLADRVERLALPLSALVGAMSAVVFVLMASLKQ